MFISAKRHEREKQELLDASNRLTEAILKNSEQGLFLIDDRGHLQPQLSQSMSSLFRRENFADLSLDKLLSPLVSAKTLSVVRNYLALLEAAPRDDVPPANPLQDVDVRMAKSDGTFDAAHYAFEFDPIEVPNEPRMWLVRVSDITVRVQTARELDELRAQLQTQGEILRGVLQQGGAALATLLQRIDASMKTINLVLKKPARAEDAFRRKLEEILEEVDRVRRDAAAFKLLSLEGSARQFEDSLHELRSRRALSGSDFLPLAVKLDQLYGQFAFLKSLTAGAAPAREPGSPARDARMTENGTQIIEAPKFIAQHPELKRPDARPAELKEVPGAQRAAPAGSLENTLRALCDHVAQEYDKNVVLLCEGLELVPAAYQSSVKNVAIQLIRNAVMHGIETAAARSAAKKPAQGTLRLEFKAQAAGGYELQFEDDGRGLDPDQVRETAIARGVITGEGAARMRDREAIKLIFKSAYTTLANVPGEPAHGTGMSLVRRYVHEAGGRIALASLLGHETRFRVTLPAPPGADASPNAHAARGMGASMSMSVVAGASMSVGPSIAAADEASTSTADDEADVST